MFVGGGYTSGVVQLLVARFASDAIAAFARREKVEIHFKKLRQSLYAILAMLDDAEEKQFLNKSVGMCLENLRDSAYDLDDILDEIETRYLIQESKEMEHCRTSTVAKCIPFRATGALGFNFKMMSKIKETTSALQLVTRQLMETGAISKNLEASFSQSSVLRLPATSLVNKSQIYGRGEDEVAIVEKLLGYDDISVISLVGTGGIGKTTLAQLVYNNRIVEQNFHTKVWVFVSEVFDVFNITKTIFKAVTGMNCESMDLNMLQVSLREKLSKSKFLIVLDEVWYTSMEKWDLFLLPFQFGVPGSKIVVTTHNDRVASLLSYPQITYRVKSLSDESCLAILAQHSRRSLNENSELRDVGQGLVRRCKGLPLAVKTLGGLLCSKETKQEWGDVLNSAIWDLPDENDIRPVLDLNYYHLPSHLEHLFACSSMFLKGCDFNMNKLVLLWIEHGFFRKSIERKTNEGLVLGFESCAWKNYCRESHSSIEDRHMPESQSENQQDPPEENMDTNLDYRLLEDARLESMWEGMRQDPLGY